MRVVALLVHADGAVSAVVHHHADQLLGAITRGGGQLLTVHQEVAVARDVDHPTLGLQQGGAYRGRQAVAHGARTGRQLRAAVVLQARVAAVTVQPTAEVAGPVGVHGAVRQPLLKALDEHGHVQWLYRRGHQVGVVVRARRSGLASPVDLGGRCQGFQRGGGAGHRRLQHQVGRIHPAQFFSAGVDVDQLLGRLRCLQQGVAVGRHLTQAHTQRNDQVGVSHTGGQRGVGADAHVSSVLGVPVVKGVLKPPGTGHGKLPVLGKALQGPRCLGVPARTASQHDGALRLHQQGPQIAQTAWRWPGPHRLDARQNGGGRQGGQHVFGQGQHHRARAPLHGGVEGARHVFGQSVSALNFCHPLGQAQRAGAEHLAVVDFLEGLAVTLVAGHLADEQHHRRAVLERRVHANAGVGGTGPAGHKTHPWAAREFALGLGHEGCTALLAAGDETNPLGVLKKAVQHGQVTFARHTEAGVYALFDQRLNQRMARRPGNNRRGGGA